MCVCVCVCVCACVEEYLYNIVHTSLSLFSWFTYGCMPLFFISSYNTFMYFFYSPISKEEKNLVERNPTLWKNVSTFSFFLLFLRPTFYCSITITTSSIFHLPMSCDSLKYFFFFVTFLKTNLFVILFQKNNLFIQIILFNYFNFHNSVFVTSFHKWPKFFELVVFIWTLWFMVKIVLLYEK